MATWTVTKKMIVNALKKDLVLITNQKKATEKYIKAGCGHFLNHQWCAGHKQVIKLHNDMIKLANKAIEKINNTKEKDDLPKNVTPKFALEVSKQALFDKVCDVFDTSQMTAKQLYFMNILLPNFSKLGKQ